MPGMRRTITENLCERGLKLMLARGKDREKFVAVAYLLAHDGRVTSAYRPHKLHGQWAGHWECHIESDWILVYKITDAEVILARTGTHADLFE